VQVKLDPRFVRGDTPYFSSRQLMLRLLNNLRQIYLTLHMAEEALGIVRCVQCVSLIAACAGVLSILFMYEECAASKAACLGSCVASLHSEVAWRLMRMLPGITLGVHSCCGRILQVQIYRLYAVVYIDASDVCAPCRVYHAGMGFIRVLCIWCCRYMRATAPAGMLPELQRDEGLCLYGIGRLAEAAEVLGDYLQQGAPSGDAAVVTAVMQKIRERAAEAAAAAAVAAAAATGGASAEEDGDVGAPGSS
jgi:hypothetical protein